MVGATGFEPATSCSRSRRATKLRYAPPTVCVLEPGWCRTLSMLPGVLSHELDEHARGMLARAHLAIDLLDELEHLAGGIAHRHHHAPSLGELLEERRRHTRPSRRHQNAIGRRLVRPAQRPVRGPYPHVGIPQYLHGLSRSRREARNPLDRAHSPREIREHGRLVPAP